MWQAWRLPTILQCALPAMSMALVLFLPESPRWLMAQNREDEAAAIFTKYHGNSRIANFAVIEICH